MRNIFNAGEEHQLLCFAKQIRRKAAEANREAEAGTGAALMGASVMEEDDPTGAAVPPPPPRHWRRWTISVTVRIE
jgi:hypothetical protein